MAAGRRWSREELLIALHLYCRLPFGKLHSRNRDIIHFAQLMGRSPSSLAMKLANFAHIDPSLERKGLANVTSQDRTEWQRMQEDWSRFIAESEQEVQQLTQRQTPTEPEMRIEDEDAFRRKAPEQTEYEYTGTVRRGQDFFRDAVLSAYDHRCCISGLSLERLLIASHIVPWSKDKDNRLNPHNGLALSALHDKAFDLGILTIDEDLRVCISQRERPADNDRFHKAALQKYHGEKITVPKKFMPEQNFLAYHRDNIFEKRLRSL